MTRCVSVWRLFLAYLLLCTAVVGASHAQNNLDQISHLPRNVIAQIEGLINDHLTSNHVRGLSVAVVVDGHRVFTQGYGFADADKKQRVQGSTPFELGSVTKSFTVFALLRIYDDPTLIRKPGIIALDLDAPLSTYLQQLSGMDYADFMQTYVFRPLHLSDTRVHTSENTPRRLAVGYQWTGAEWITPTPRLPEASFSSGAIISTAFDLGKFLAALAERKILQPATYDLMWTAIQLPNHSSDWGLGWGANVTPQYSIYRKDGAVPGYSAQLSIYENHGVSVAIASNANEVPVEQLAAQLAAAVIGVQQVPNPSGPPSDCQ